MLFKMGPALRCSFSEPSSQCLRAFIYCIAYIHVYVICATYAMHQLISNLKDRNGYRVEKQLHINLSPVSKQAQPEECLSCPSHVCQRHHLGMSAGWPACTAAMILWTLNALITGNTLNSNSESHWVTLILFSFSSPNTLSGQNIFTKYFHQMFILSEVFPFDLLQHTCNWPFTFLDHPRPFLASKIKWHDTFKCNYPIT